MAEKAKKILQDNQQGADWFDTEIDRGTHQAKTGETVNADALVAANGQTDRHRKKPKVKRVNKGFQVEEGRAQAWDILVARMKSNPSNKKTGPELIDEAIDYILDKYGS